MQTIRETYLIFIYNLWTTLRNPVWVVVGIIQPILWLLLFAPLLDGVAGAPGFPSGGTLTVFTPGILMTIAIFGTLFVGFGLIADLRAGVLERLAVTPASRLALALGRILRDVVVLVVQSLLLLLVAVLMGLTANLLGVVITFALMVLIGVMTASCSYALALLIRDENSFSPTVNFFTLPLLLLSGILLPLALAPRWMQAFATVNPFAHALDAARTLFLDGVGDVSVAYAFVIVGVLAVLALVWAVRSFRRVV